MPNVGFIRNELGKQLPKYKKIRDCIDGEDAVKAQKSLYLPIPETCDDQQQNLERYGKYVARAVFYNVVNRTSEGLVGQVFQKKIAFDVPEQFEFLQNDVDGAGTTLEQQAKRVTQELVTIGRGGLLVDSPIVEPGQVVTRANIEDGSIRPKILFYTSESIINWRTKSVGGKTFLSMVTFFESTEVDDDGFEIKHEPRWREYRIDEETGLLKIQLWKRKDRDKNAQAGQAGQGDDYEEDGGPIFPTDKDGNFLDFIPFIPLGVLNNDIGVDKPPMEDLANLNLAHFRDSADYQQSSFLCGQATPVFKGLPQEWVDTNMSNGITLGSANAVALPVGADAMLLQASPNSQPFEAMGQKEDQMKALGAKLIEPGTVQRTATEAEIEETSEASILSSAAKNISAGYEKAVMYCDSFIGDGVIDDDEIKVQLNSEFQIMGLNAQERQEVVAAWQSGLITREEAREVYRKKGIATENDEDAFTKIDAELSTPFGEETLG